MPEPPRLPIQVFDPRQDVVVVDRRLPHWLQAGTACFITWRTWDSIPKPVLKRWLRERWQFLREHGVDPMAENWSWQLCRLDRYVQDEFRRTFSERWHAHLDACHGACVLRRPELARIVADSLSHAGGDRYELTDFVIMPNHVHLLAAFPDEESLLVQCESWKRYTATRIHRSLGRKGRFWQQDGFDHLVRSPEEFAGLRQYIADNPRRAQLGSDEFRHFSKPMP
jgi:REP element-mobilizing transposase RayT